MKKRYWIAILCAVFALIAVVLLPDMLQTAVAEGETSGECGDGVYWAFDETTGTLTISGTGEISVSYWNPPWEAYKDGVNRVVVGDGVTYIPGSAFAELTNLVSAHIGRSVAEIGWNPFAWSRNLKEITVDPNNTSFRIVDGALISMDGTALYAYPPQKDGSSYVIPDGVTWIKGNAFSAAKKLNSVTIPNSVTIIDGWSFSESGLTSVTIPESVTDVYGEAFNACTSLETVIVHGKDTNLWGDGDGCEGVFENCPNLRSVTMPCSISTGEHTFRGCYSLEELHLTVGSGEINPYMIEDLLFWYHYTEFYCWNEETQSWEDGELPAAKPLSVILDEGITSIPEGTFDSNYFYDDDYDSDSAIASVTLPASIAEIGENAFAHCGNLKDVYYGSTEEQKENIDIAAGNEDLLNATWHYQTPVFTPAVEWNAEDVKFKGSTPYVICNGSAQTPRFTVKNAEDGSVIDPANYDYDYRENTNAGTGYVIVTFKGDYTGECQGWFKIYLPATEHTYVENVSNGIKVTWDPVEGAAGYVIYRRAWSSTTNGWTTFERWNNTTGTTYIDGADANHKVYAGSRYQYGVKAYFARRTDPVSGATIGGNVGDNFNLGEVGPLKTTVRITTRKLVQVRPGSKQMTVKWEASKNFTGYQIKYATDANFTKNVKAFKIGDPTTYWTTIKSLQSNTTYYVCIRSYHEFGGMTYFGEWSNVLSCKVK